MRSFRRTGAPALVAAVALAVSTIPAAGLASGLFAGSGASTAAVPAAMPAAAQLTPSAPAGTLSLTTAASTGQVDWVDSDGVAALPAPQILTQNSNCLLSQRDSSLLEIQGLVGTGVTNRAGFKYGKIGVVETSFSPLCYRVDKTTFASQSEMLILKLGSALVDDFGPLLATSASLNVELSKPSARIQATATGPNGLSETFTSPSTCTTVNNGNCLWKISPSVPFDKLTLKPTSGSFSLEGGPDAGPTTFVLVGTTEDVLDCENTTIVEGTSTATFVGNAGATGCEGAGFGVVLTKGDDFTELVKPLGVDADAQFVFDLKWTEDANVDWASSDPLVKRTTADFDGDAEGSNPPATIAWCPDLVSTTVGDDTFLVVEDVANNTKAVDQAPDYPGAGTDDTKQFACIVSQTPILDSATDVLTVKERVYVYGDIKLQRP